MWIVVSVILAIIIYVVIRFNQQRNTTTGQTRTRVFSGLETHAIVLMNDDVNPMETVVNTLVRVLGIPEKQAINLMLRVHQEGIAIVWTGGSGEAEYYLQSMREAGLRCFLTEIAPHIV